MIQDVKYRKETYYQGRNGLGIQAGLSVSIDGNCLKLEPINSKGSISNCQIRIPYGNINDVLDQLTKGLCELDDLQE